MEGPYRDLGGGFVRLTGVEGARRSPSRISFVEDALYELLRNSIDAGAGNIYVATTLRRRRYRTLTVIDDGRGIPEPFGALIFEPGVTTRHLDPTPDHGAGLSLYHLKNVSLSAEVLSTSAPAAIRATFDTQTLPERSLQSRSRPSKTNLLATLQKLLQQHPPENRPNIYISSPAKILPNLMKNHIIPRRQKEHRGRNGRGQEGVVRCIREDSGSLGLDVSVRTVQRVLAGDIGAVERAEISISPHQYTRNAVNSRDSGSSGGEVLVPELNLEEISEIRTILESAARARYLEIGEIEAEAGRGGWVLQVPVYEPEEEYE